jgi:hypothetical protein
VKINQFILSGQIQVSDVYTDFSDMSWDFDFSQFSVTSISSWMSFINRIPRFPYLYVADSFTTCFIIRSAARIKNPLISFVLGLAIATFADNCDALLNNHKLAVFEHKFLFPVFAGAWLIFNYCPFDLIFKLAKCVSLLGAFVNGFLAGRDVTRGVDLAVTHFPTSWIPVILTATFVGAGKHVLLYLYSGIYRQKARSAGPIIFGIMSAALAYYWFTDFGHISNSIWFDKEETRLAVIVVLSLFGFVHSAVNDSAFTTFHDVIAEIIGFVVPYYGQIWEARRPRGTQRPVAPLSQVRSVPGGKIKTE